MKKWSVRTLFGFTLAAVLFLLAFHFIDITYHWSRYLHLRHWRSHTRATVSNSLSQSLPALSAILSSSTEEPIHLGSSSLSPHNVDLHKPEQSESTFLSDTVDAPSPPKEMSGPESASGGLVGNPWPGQSLQNDEEKTVRQTIHDPTRSLQARSHLLPQSTPAFTDDKSHGQNEPPPFVFDPRKHYLLTRFMGRLGNFLFEFASAYCIALLNNLTLVAMDSKYFEDLSYQGIRVPLEKMGDWKSNLTVKGHGMRACCAFNPNIAVLTPKNISHSLGGHRQSWKYFEPCKAEVKRAIRFKDTIVNQAASIVANLRKELPGRTLVGVHVRMEDYLSSRAMANGKTVAPPGYYHQAMAYFRSHFRKVIFVVITSSPTWFRHDITNASDVLLLKRNASPAVDMELLSQMDHIIISVGTFGWWAAYKNSGTVVCYKDFYVPDSKYGRQVWKNGSDFIHPAWVAL